MANGSYWELPSTEAGTFKFRFVISKGFDAYGKRRRHSENITYHIKEKDPEKAHAKAIEKADADLVRLSDKVKASTYVKPTHFTFKEYVDKWKVDAERELAPKTFYRYMELLNMRIIPELGGVKLEDINAVMLDDFYNTLREPQKKIRKYANGTEKEIVYTLSEQTIRHHHRLISAILAKAAKKGIIESNQAEKADAPKVKKSNPNSYEMEDIDALIAALDAVTEDEFKYKVAVMIALTGGLRLGEVCGLESPDIDHKDSTIHIQRASQYLPHQGTFTKDPKTEQSDRLVTLPPEVMDLISELEHQNKIRRVELGTKWRGFGSKDEEGNDRNMPDRLFIQPNGEPMHPYSPSKWFNKFLKDNKLKPLVFHGLRHTSASYLIAQGEDVVTVSKRLGHSNTSTTLNVYSHSFKKRDEEAAAKMSGMFKKKEEEKQVK